MPIDLTKARPGDRYRSRDGEVWTYERSLKDGHVLSREGAEGEELWFEDDGCFVGYNGWCGHDLVADIPETEFNVCRGRL